MGIFGKIAALLNASEKRELVLLGIVTLCVALFEVAGVASIMPFLAVVSNPEAIQENAGLRWVWERGGFSDPSAYLFALGLLVFTLVVVTNVLNTLNAWLSNRFIGLRNHSISTRLLAHYLEQPYAYFLRRNTSEMGANILTEVQSATRGVMMQAIILVTRTVSMLAILLLLLLVDPVLALLIFCAVGGVYGIFFVAVRSFLRRSGQQRHALLRSRYRIANEAFGGIKDVKVRDLGDRFVRRYSVATERFARIEVINAVLGSVPRYVLEIAAFGTILLILLVQIERGQDLSTVVPVMGLYALAGLRLMPALQAIFAAATKLRHNEPIIESLLSDLQHHEASQEAAPEPCPPMERALSFHDVGFRYAGAEAPTLRGIDITIPHRSTIGLVGSTGAGKTTLLDLILGLLAPESGEIRVDGTPLRSGMRRAWRTRVGYVPQHIFLMDDSLRANIAFGLDPEEIDEERMREAARLASLDSFVETQLPDAYETRVGERGVRLSGGQIQRVGIARALYPNPELLLFDEATSALDNVTERNIMEAIDNLAGEKTIVLIAHRLSTVRRCDRIYLLEQGAVRASGSWEELMEVSPEFRAMAAADGLEGEDGSRVSPSTLRSQSSSAQDRE